jgi:putative NADH-flavin reductase
MKLVILRATGTTGGHAMDEALVAGHEVVASVRDPSALRPRKGLTVIGGCVEEEIAMYAVFAASDAVISCLGLRATPGNLLRRVDFQQRINAAGLKRFVLMSSFGVGETRAMSDLIPRVIFGSIAKRLFADKAIAERALPSCGRIGPRSIWWG